MYYISIDAVQSSQTATYIGKDKNMSFWVEPGRNGSMEPRAVLDGGGYEHVRAVVDEIIAMTRAVIATIDKEVGK